jgi:hypothetical protein
LLWRVAGVAQVRDHVCDVCELLLEVSLVGLEPREQLLAVRERPAEVDPSTSVSVSMVVHCHLLSS